MFFVELSLSMRTNLINKTADAIAITLCALQVTPDATQVRFIKG